jgi:hypothetical protein
MSFTNRNETRMDSKTKDTIHRMTDTARWVYIRERLLADVTEAGGYDNLEVRDHEQAIALCKFLYLSMDNLEDFEGGPMDVKTGILALDEFLRSPAGKGWVKRDVV